MRTTIPSDLSSYDSLSRLSGLGFSSFIKVPFELLTSLMRIYQNDQQTEWLKNLAPTFELSFQSSTCCRLKALYIYIYISTFDSEIIYHYPCLHADFVRLCSTPGSGVGISRYTRHRYPKLNLSILWGALNLVLINVGNELTARSRESQKAHLYVQYNVGTLWSLKAVAEGGPKISVKSIRHVIVNQ